MSDTTTAPRKVKEQVGRYGVWSVALRSEDPDLRGEITEAAAELEELGFGAAWLGGSSAPRNALPLLEGTSRLVVGTSIQSIWDHDAETSAAAFADVEAAHPGRFLLGLGVSHAPLAPGYRRPYSALVAYLDGLDKGGVPVGRRVVAALGPRSLELSRERAAGVVPYLVTPEHTAQAREILGESALLAPEFKVVPETDPGRARTLAREALAMYLTLPNYTNNFLRLGFTEDDLSGGGSDRLIDALYAWGDEDRIRTRINAFHEAGADHVAIQIVDGTPRDTLQRQAWRNLASLLS
ncbi:LLM class F420-dependent oxidoreductase [Streptomyces sp. NPDC026672]|uniref:LLM class F420-dependent oxidoreductase n=1 Tax=unclassified Streptomyces TaxID=2593676 RepID=UPI0034109CA7